MSSLKRDLVERRLWPLAVILVAAIVAVPFLVHGHRSKQAAVVPAPSPKAVATPTQASSGHNEPVSDHHAHTQKLRMSNSRNPFAAMVVQNTPHAGSGSSSSGGAASSGSSPSSSSTTSPVVDGTGASTSSTTTEPTAGATGSSASTGTAGSSSSTGGSSAGTSSSAGTETSTSTTSTTPTSPGGTPDTRSWTIYSVDARYGVRGVSTSRVNLARLSPLPVRAPRAMFVGVADHGREAAFLIGAGVGATGQGRCHPSRRECTMVTLSAGQREALYYLTKNGAGRTAVLQVQKVSGRVTHTASTAETAYNRLSLLGLCDLELGDPLGVVYDPTQGSLKSLDMKACRRDPSAVAFPGTASGAESSVLP